MKRQSTPARPGSPLAAVLLTLAIGWIQTAAAADEQFAFALIGDTPYGIEPGGRAPVFAALTEAINAEPQVRWVLHAGDIKSGSSPCSDAMLQDRLKRFNAFTHPFILTPGDNEWTDCHRVSAGEYAPLERLARLRELFYPVPGRSLGGSRMALDTQARQPGNEAYVENQRWSHQDVVFATLHLVGSRNGLRQFDPDSAVTRTAVNDAEVADRTEAALDWLAAAFEHARERQSPGVFLMIHANPGLDAGRAARAPYREFLVALDKHVRAFDNPVVLAHGDTHRFRIDQPALTESDPPEHFTRVETFGPNQPRWIRVTVDPESAQVFDFSVEKVEPAP